MANPGEGEFTTLEHGVKKTDKGYAAWVVMELPGDHKGHAQLLSQMFHDIISEHFIEQGIQPAFSHEEPIK